MDFIIPNCFDRWGPALLGGYAINNIESSLNLVWQIAAHVYPHIITVGWYTYGYPFDPVTSMLQVPCQWPIEGKGLLISPCRWLWVQTAKDKSSDFSLASAAYANLEKVRVSCSERPWNKSFVYIFNEWPSGQTVTFRTPLWILEDF